MRTTRQKEASWQLGGALLLLAAGCVPLTGRWDGNGVRGHVVQRATDLPVDGSSPLVVIATPVAGPALRQSTTRSTQSVDEGPLPSFLVIPIGESIRFVNNDEICHSFFSSSPENAFDLGLLQPGKHNTFRFEHPGTVHVYCSLHSKKQATILVAPSRHFAIVGRGGEFEIIGLPPGHYVLETWMEGRPPQRLEVTVPSRGNVYVRIPIDDPPVQGAG